MDVFKTMNGYDNIDRSVLFSLLKLGGYKLTAHRSAHRSNKISTQELYCRLNLHPLYQ